MTVSKLALAACSPSAGWRTIAVSAARPALERGVRAAPARAATRPQPKQSARSRS